MIGALSLALGLINLLIWFRQSTQPAPLIFTLIALCTCALSMVELQMLRAQTPAQYATAVRWLHVAASLLSVLLVLFVRLRYRVGPLWLGAATCAVCLAYLLPNFLTGENLSFRNVTALHQIDLWGGGTAAIPLGEPNPWMVLYQLGDLMLVLFLGTAAVSAWRQKNAAGRNWAILVCGGMTVFVALASAWGTLINLGSLRIPYSITGAFVIVLIVMSYEFVDNVLRAPRLAHQLGESESNLLESKQRLQLAAQAAGIGLFTWDTDSNQAWFTETGSTLLGMLPGEHIDRESLLERIHPEDRQAVLRARGDAIRTGEFACEYRIAQPEGDVRWIAAKGRVEYTSSRQPNLIRGVIMDITEQRHAEERFRLMVESAPTAMLMVDNEGNIVLSNEQVERIFDYNRTELLGQSIDILVPDRSLQNHRKNRANFIANPVARAFGSEGGLYGRRKDGSDVPLEIGLNPIRMGGNLFVLTSITDISDRLRIEQELAIQRAELAHLSRISLLGEMSGSLAHELNQPLTAILSNAQAGLRFLNRDLPDLDEVRESLGRIVENDKRAGDVIRRLRAMLRKEQIAHQQLDINEVVHDVLRLINSDLLNRKVSLILDLTPNLPEIQGDRVQLQQVLLNLVINACDAMDEMNAKHLLTIRTKLVPDASIEVSISDVGRGIPLEDLERIFAPFVTTKVDGMGLGLAVCRTIVQAHSGTLWATNNSPRGAVLHFVLPASVVQ